MGREGVMEIYYLNASCKQSSQVLAYVSCIFALNLFPRNQFFSFLTGYSLLNWNEFGSVVFENNSR